MTFYALPPTVIPISSTPTAARDASIVLLKAFNNEDNYVYEREGTWNIGIGSEASLIISPDAGAVTVHTTTDGHTTARSGTLGDVATSFIHRYAIKG